MTGSTLLEDLTEWAAGGAVMSTGDLLALLVSVGLVAALCWRYPLHLANAVRRGEIPEDQPDDPAEVSGL